MTKLSQYGTEYTLADRGNASSYPVGCVCVCVWRWCIGGKQNV